MAVGLLKNAPCHSREGGNRDPRAEILDSRMRGNDRIEMRAGFGAADAFIERPAVSDYSNYYQLFRKVL